MPENELVRPQVTGLEDALGAGIIEPDRGRRLARQIALELCAAHQYGSAHGPLKPGHIVLIGSGKDERAVITGFATDTNLDDDMQAFGYLLELLVPGHRLASECAAANPKERPQSFEIVLEELQAFSLWRTWVGSLLIGAATASLFAYELVTRAHVLG